MWALMGGYANTHACSHKEGLASHAAVTHTHIFNRSQIFSVCETKEQQGGEAGKTEGEKK